MGRKKLYKLTRRKKKILLVVAACTVLVSIVLASNHQPVDDARYEPLKKTYGIAMGQEFVYQSIDVSKRQLKDIKAAGFTDVRFVVSWYIVQPDSKTKFNWSKYDQIFKAVQDAKLQPLAIITYTPAWARMPACKKSAYCAPVSAQDYGDFAADVSKRYNSKGLHQFEIWNEENIKSFWQPTPSAEQYAPLLKAAYTAIKKQDKNSVVISGGMSGVSVAGPGYLEPRAYLTDLYKLGIKDYSDAIGYHAYTFPDSPATIDPRNGWAKINSVPDSLRLIMTRNGDIRKQIWVTEYGAPTNGKGDAATSQTYKRTAHTDHVSEAYQSTMAEVVNKKFQESEWIGSLYWYTWQDKGTTLDTNENFFGLTDRTGRHKPALEILMQGSK